MLVAFNGKIKRIFIFKLKLLRIMTPEAGFPGVRTPLRNIPPISIRRKRKSLNSTNFIES